jgi:hypothetical protein
MRSVFLVRQAQSLPVRARGQTPCAQGRQSRSKDRSHAAVGQLGGAQPRILNTRQGYNPRSGTQITGERVRRYKTRFGFPWRGLGIAREISKHLRKGRVSDGSSPFAVGRQDGVL